MKYLKVWTSFREVIEPLSDAEKGRLFVMMLDYAESFTEPAGFAGNERFIWPAAKQLIDLTYSESIRLSENGKKGGRPKSNRNQSEATESNENQTEPNESHKEKKSNIKKGNIKENNTDIRRFTPPSLQEVTEYCQERGNSVDPSRFIDFYASKGWKVGNQPMKDWKACIRTWEQREGKSVKTVIAQGYEQRDYQEVQDEILKKQNERILKRLEVLA